MFLRLLYSTNVYHFCHTLHRKWLPFIYNLNTNLLQSNYKAKYIFNKFRNFQNQWRMFLWHKIKIKKKWYPKNYHAISRLWVKKAPRNVSLLVIRMNNFFHSLLKHNIDIFSFEEFDHKHHDKIFQNAVCFHWILGFDNST